MPFSLSVSTYSLSMRADISTKFSFVRWLNMIISSRRLRNSGLRNSERAALTFSAVACACVLAKPRALSFLSLPALEVITITVLLKLTFLPCASVKTPSSNICKSIFSTSGCAFSISSKSNTEYGLRLTFSVTCPASS